GSTCISTSSYLDGVYLLDNANRYDSPLTFHDLPTPTRAETTEIAGRIADRVEVIVKKQGCRGGRAPPPGARVRCRVRPRAARAALPARPDPPAGRPPPARRPGRAVAARPGQAGDRLQRRGMRLRPSTARTAGTAPREKRTKRDRTLNAPKGGGCVRNRRPRIIAWVVLGGFAC